MAEKIYQHRHPKDITGEATVSGPEINIEGGIPVVSFDVESNCDFATEDAVEVIEQEMGDDWRIRDMSGPLFEGNDEGKRDNSSSTRTTFSSNRWNSTWEPSGPKKNWMIEPPDPRAN